MITEVTKLLGIQYPVIQGGMAWVAEHHLAAAVSEAGALASSEHRRHRQSGFGMKSAKQKTDGQTVRRQHHADEPVCG